MGAIKNLIFRMKRGVASFITMSSTSVSATWSPQTITNTGITLDWTVSGDVTIAKTTIDDPTFDFSGNSGTADILVENVEGLTYLACYNNSLTALDISKDIALTGLNCGYNSLTALNISSNTALTVLDCGLNSITALDVSANTALIYLACYENSLTALNISSNTALTELYCGTNPLMQLDVSTNISLTRLECSSNSLNALDISANTELIGLWCFGNNQAPSVTDQIFIDLDTNAKINGNLYIRNNRTSASDTARANLITKGWSVQDTYTS